MRVAGMPVATGMRVVVRMAVIAGAVTHRRGRLLSRTRRGGPGRLLLAWGPIRAPAHFGLPAVGRETTSRTTAMAAPKPLSMFTTVTPDAQLERSPNSAVRPPNDTP